LGGEKVVGGNGRSPWKVDSLVAEHFELDGVVVEAVLAQDLHGAHHGFPAGASLGCARIPSASQEGSNKRIVPARFVAKENITKLERRWGHE
jgi:hypothetical protein